MLWPSESRGSQRTGCVAVSGRPVAAAPLKFGAGSNSRITSSEFGRPAATTSKAITQAEVLPARRPRHIGHDAEVGVNGHRTQPGKDRIGKSDPVETDHAAQHALRTGQGPSAEEHHCHNDRRT
jgi:hypothetical protein